ADYYALGHLHIDFQYQNFVYPSPIFPNNFQELEDLNYGSFYIVDTDAKISDSPLKKIELKIKDVVVLNIEIKNALIATEKIISEIDKVDIDGKILLLRIRGEIEKGKNSDIRSQQIEEFAKQKGAYFVLKNTHELKTNEVDLEIEVMASENIEEEAVNVYSKKNPSDFNKLIPQLMNSLSIEKQEGETTDSFSSRLMEESKKVLGF
ncbi:MAG: hypothetical protein AABX88_01030, partial [Nanoarchaeota archaeon]